MKDCKISIIVPIYNAEKYLRRCLDSLVNQTMKEIEIILVNDASPDSSDRIMEEYRRRYPEQIHCIYHERNLGPGGGRNTGIRAAKGEYVLFVDSDDYVDITICEKLYRVAREKNSDSVSCEYRTEQKGNCREVDLFSSQVMGDLDYEKRRLLMSIHSVAPHAKIVRKSIIVENNLYFPEHIKFEDLAIVPLWWVYIKRYDEVKEPIYYYMRHENSVTCTKNSTEYYDLFEKVSKYIYQQFINRGLQKEYRECIDNILLRAFIDEIKFLLRNVDEPDEEKLRDFKKYILELIPDYKKNPMLYMRNDPNEIEAADILMHSEKEFCDILRNHRTDEIKGNYDAYYEMRKERIDDFLAYCTSHHYRIAVWGAGIKGKDFLRIADPKATNIQYVIDKNDKKWGKELETGHTIQDFYKLSEQIDVVLAVNRVYFGGIYREVKQADKRIKVVNLDLLLISDIIYNIEDFME